MPRHAPLIVTCAFLLVCGSAARSWSDDSMLTLHLRSQVKTPAGETEKRERLVEWDPHCTALIVIDMWDDHWCRSAADRVVEIAPKMNQVIKAARAQGVFIIHAPSTCTKFYEGTPQRKRAQTATFAPLPKPLTEKERWGTKWNYPDPQHEPAKLPIDDSDMGCDCAEKCEIRGPWTRQIDLIEIGPDDAITDNGQETWNLFAERKIENVIVLGVHLNMCVLGRPFAIRQMVYHGKPVVLVRDMTDTMYDPRMPPKISHFAGTSRMIDYVEQYWCPTILSSDLTGQEAFVFKGATATR